MPGWNAELCMWLMGVLSQLPVMLQHKPEACTVKAANGDRVGEPSCAPLACMPRSWSLTLQCLPCRCPLHREAAIRWLGV